MSSSEIEQYIRNRNYELSSDEILTIIDTSRNPQIDHIVYENEQYKIWDESGNYFEFKKRNW